MNFKKLQITNSNVNNKNHTHDENSSDGRNNWRSDITHNGGYYVQSIETIYMGDIETYTIGSSIIVPR